MSVASAEKPAPLTPVKTPLPSVSVPSAVQVPAPAPTPGQTPAPTPVPTPKPAPVHVRSAEEDIVEKGFISPTIYFTPIFQEDDSTCPATEKMWMFGPNGVRYLKLCKKDLDSCGLQGTCFIFTPGKLRRFNIIDRVDGVDHYMELSTNDCQYGYGVRDICLDPFYTVAADLRIYSPGDVIRVDAVKGTLLPDGSHHSGFFVVRDEGRGITGKGRFDFFTGFISWRDEANPFSKLKLSDENTHLEFERFTGPTAEKIRQQRSFPH